MKFPKFSILILVFSLTSMINVYADTDENSSVEQILSLNVGPYFSLERVTSSNLKAAVHIANPTSLVIDTPIAVSYNIESNSSGAVSISATAPVSDGTGTVNALYGDAANAMTIVFTKSDSTTASSAVSNCVSSGATADSNKNAIAFRFTVDTPTTTFGSAPGVSINNNAILYQFGAGAYNLPFKIEGSSLLGTFSFNDFAGDYKATLTVSKISA